MTMSRSEKAKHEAAIKGGELPNFQSPTLIQRLGRKQMTTADYREHRMGRRPGALRRPFSLAMLVNVYPWHTEGHRS